MARRRWRLLTILAVLGALLAAGSWFLLVPGYTSASKILLQGPREEEEVLGEAQIATSLTVLGRAADGLEWDVTGRRLQDSVTAAVGDGNVIEINATAATPDRSQQLTARVIEEYMAFSGQIVSDTADAAEVEVQQRRSLVQEEIDEITPRIAALQASPLLSEQSLAGTQARAEFDQLRTTLARTTIELEEIDDAARDARIDATAARGRMIVIEPPLPGTPAAPTLVQLAIGGGLAFFLLGLVALVAVARTDRRMGTSEEIAATLGAPVLGEVDIAVTPDMQPATVGGLRRLLRDDVRWAIPAATGGAGGHDDVRYQRVLARLRGVPGAHLRVLVLIPADDIVAQWAVARLAMAAAVDGGPVSVVTDDADLTELVRSTAARCGPAGLHVSVRASTDVAPQVQRTVLRVVTADPDRPIVPDSGAAVSGVLVVLSVGTRTDWQLVGLAGSCLDAGQPVLGVLVVSPRRASTADRSPEQEAATTNGAMLAGSA